MTLEEATEVILAGGAWTKCPHCKGCGSTISFEVHDEVKSIDCKACGTKGYELLPSYASACAVLGFELPTRPANVGELAEQMRVAMAVAVKLPVEFVFPFLSKMHS